LLAAKIDDKPGTAQTVRDPLIRVKCASTSTAPSRSCNLRPRPPSA
jgi:hypothetical protein